MSKQELIREIKELELVENSSYGAESYNDAIRHVIEIVDEQLDEMEKVVVPKFVAEWIEYAKKKGDSLSASFKLWDLYGAEYGKLNSWIKDNEETYARAWLDGYEVEKEPLYYVKLPEIGYMRFGKKYFYSTDTEDAKRYTESQIKAIDERYWPFAVKVDGE